MFSLFFLLDFQLAPLATKKMFPGTYPVFIIVSPLVVLMEDQMQEASKLGIMQIAVNNHSNIKQKCIRLSLEVSTPFELLPVEIVFSD